jgi:hypothetical protein
MDFYEKLLIPVDDLKLLAIFLFLHASFGMIPLK